MLTVHRVNAFTDNYIWLIEATETREVIIVDPGDASVVLKALDDAQLKPVAIFITHHHHDHTDGVIPLLAKFSIPVYGPSREPIDGVSHWVSNAQTIEIDHFPLFTVLDTPGHTPGHISFYAEQKLFCGDTLFAAGCGRLLGGTAGDLFDSLGKLSTLPASTEIYCAHEYTLSNLKFAHHVDAENSATKKRLESVQQKRNTGQVTVPSLMSEEWETNPFLRCDSAAIKKASEAFAGRPLNSALEVFITLRDWKNQF